MYFLYRLGIKPKEIYRLESDRTWSIIAEEIECRFHLDNPGNNKKIRERKRIEGYLIVDFNEPFSSASATLLSPDYIVKANDKIHIKLVPSPLDSRRPVLTKTPAESHSNSQTEDERLALLQNPPRAQHTPHRCVGDKSSPPLPYAKPVERPLTGIPRSMRAESYKQLYGQPMPSSKQ